MRRHTSWIDSRLPLAALLLVAVALRVAAAFWWQSQLADDVPFFFGDSKTYWQLGQTLAAGEPYQLGANEQITRAPGYPLLLAGLFRLTSVEVNVIGARLLGALIGALAVLPVVWLAGRLFDRRVALVAGLMVAVYPEAIFASILVLSDGTFATVMLLQMALWIAAWQASSSKQSILLAILSGAVAGVAILIRPSWLLFVPFAVTCVVVVSKERRRHAVHGLAMMLAICVVMLPWWVRNASITGRFVPTTLQVGASLYDGLNPHATGASEMTHQQALVAHVRQEFRDDRQGHRDSLEFTTNRRLRDASLSWAGENPGRVVQLAVTKIIRTWNVWPNAQDFRGTSSRVVILLSYLPLLALSLYGAIAFSRQGWPYVVCWLPAAYLLLLHSVFVGSLRYRGPAMMLLAVLAAGALGKLLWGSREDSSKMSTARNSS